MRYRLLLPVLLAACASENPPSAERAFDWEAPEGYEVVTAAILPGGEIFVGLDGITPVGSFLSPGGEEVEAVELASLCDECGGLRPAQPIAIGDWALFGPAAGGEPVLRIQPATRRLRHLPLENPRRLPIGAFFLDGGRAAVLPGGSQLVVPGDALMELSPDAIVTNTHVTGALRAIAHVRDDLFTFIDADGYLGGWRKGDGSVAAFDLPVARIGGGDGFTVVGLQEEGTIELFLYGDPLRPLDLAFVNQIELAVAPDARRLIVGVRDQPIDAAADLPDAPPARTALVLDGSGDVLGKVELPAPIVAVHISPDGKRAVVAHEAGVAGLALR